MVCIQEAKLCGGEPGLKAAFAASLDAAAAAMNVPSYKAFWGLNQTAGTAGVAVLVRKDLLDLQRFQVIGAPVVAADGRLITMRCKWGGHAFSLANAYFPSGAPAAQRTFVVQRLRAVVAACRGPVLLAGDFNFTSNWRVDRRQQRQPLPQQHHPDEGPAEAMQQLCGEHGLADAFRRLHPSRRSYTWHGRGSASRIDRVYASEALIPFVRGCDAGGCTVSDHRPVILHLQPKVPMGAGRGRGRPRIRLDFMRDTALAARFEEWLQERLAEAPTHDPSELLEWWPGFKKALADMAATLRREHGKATSGALVAVRDAALADFLQQMAAVEEAADSAPAALDLALAARRRFTVAAAATAVPAENLARHAWIRTGERPSPAMSKLLCPPRSARQIAALKGPGGGLVTGVRAMASMVARFYAAVSCSPTADQVAEQQVMQAVMEHATQLAPSLAEEAGDPVVSAEEVASALKRQRQGTAPGPDGLPVGVWRLGKGAMQEVLAAVFSAVGSTGRVPVGFLEGVVCPIFKSGERADVANYRPITLLNSDYRLMTKILATRLSPVLAAAIGPEQTAFLPGRLIGDNIAFLQLLPEQLRCNLRKEGLSQTGVLAFLDFRKAYDTVSRDFLFQVMRTVGAGQGLLKWAETLLTDTTAAAEVNGCVSAKEAYKAGVRQGCPLAPALYLFVAWALACWLRTCPSVGLTLGPGRVVYGTQYADDAQVLLKSLCPSDVQVFLDHMGTFARASGQHLNDAKSTLMPVGVAAGPEHMELLPGTVCGLRVVREARALGVPVADGPGPGVDWRALLDGAVGPCFRRAADLHLSIFGRAQAAATYGVGRLLYAGEHSDMPEPVVEELEKITKAVVDRGVGPPAIGQPDTPAMAARRRHPPGVHSTLLVGRPGEGGFGAMPWRQHMLARRAVLARRYVMWVAGQATGPGAPPWVPMATAILLHMCPAVHPALALLGACHGHEGQQGRLPPQLAGVGGSFGGPALPQGPLSRMARGLGALGPLTVGKVPEVAAGGGGWCVAAPLWGNPMLQLEYRSDQRRVEWQPLPPLPMGATAAVVEERRLVLQHWDTGFAHMVPFPGLATVGELLSLVRIVNRLGGRLLRNRLGQADRYQALRKAVWGDRAESVWLPLMVREMMQQWSPGEAGDALYTTLLAMEKALPQELRQAAQRLLPPMDGNLPPPLDLGRGVMEASGVAVRLLLPCLGWDMPHDPRRRARQALARGEVAQATEQRRVSLVKAPPMTVKRATTAQLGGAWETRHSRREEFVLEALSRGHDSAPQPQQLAEAHAHLEGAMEGLWGIHWENAQEGGAVAPGGQRRAGGRGP